MSESCRYDLNRPYACQTHNTQWLDDDADQCEYKRMIDAESSIQRVRELCERSRVAISRGCTCYTDECSGCCYGTPLAWDLDPKEVLAVLDEICT